MKRLYYELRPNKETTYICQQREELEQRPWGKNEDKMEATEGIFHIPCSFFFLFP
jgi:hypothetical protein